MDEVFLLLDGIVSCNKAIVEGKFMVLGNKMEEQGSGSEEGEDENSAGGYTIGGDVSFFEWDHESFMPPKE